MARPDPSSPLAGEDRGGGEARHFRTDPGTHGAAPASAAWRAGYRFRNACTLSCQTGRTAVLTGRTGGLPSKMSISWVAA